MLSCNKKVEIMIESYHFVKAIVDAITQHIAVINSKENILFANQSWVDFAIDNDC